MADSSDKCSATPSVNLLQAISQNNCEHAMHVILNIKDGNLDKSKAIEALLRAAKIGFFRIKSLQLKNHNADFTGLLAAAEKEHAKVVSLELCKNPLCNVMIIMPEKHTSVVQFLIECCNNEIPISTFLQVTLTSLHLSVVDATLQSEIIRLRTQADEPFSDENMSDTDSEDEPGYSFSLAPSSFVKTMSNYFTANLNEKSVLFAKESVKPDGNCGFTGLKTDRKKLADRLLESAGKVEVRQLVWEEIATALLTEGLKLKGSDVIVQNYHDGNNEILKEYCCTEEVFTEYINLYTTTEMWLGCHTAMAFAYACNFKLYIWNNCPANSGLFLAQQSKNVSANTAQDIHLLHTGSFSHFDVLHVVPDTETVRKGMEQLHIGANSEKKPAAIAHYRGIHFYKEHYNREARKSARVIDHLQQLGEIPRTGMFSCATHEVSSIPLVVCSANFHPEVLTRILNEREANLTKANEQIIKEMSALQKASDIGVKACLGTSRSSRSCYQSRFLEYVQRYVNSYEQLKKDMRKAKEIQLDCRQSQRTREKWDILHSLNFTHLPFVSTSETLCWGLKYAYGLGNLTTTSQPDKYLSPEYQRDGHPRFPYLGIIYATLHQLDELNNPNCTRLLDLFRENLIDFRSASPGGNNKSGYIRARERVFIGGVGSEHVYFSTVVRVPNFRHDYRQFCKEKYGITKKEYDKFKNNLSRFGAITQEQTMRNKSEFLRTVKNIIEHVMEKQIESIVANISASEGFEIKFLGIMPDIVEDTEVSIKRFHRRKTNSP